MRIPCKYVWLSLLAVVLLYLVGCGVQAQTNTTNQYKEQPKQYFIPFDVPAIEKSGDCIPITSDDRFGHNPCPLAPSGAVITSGKTHQYGWYLAPNCEDKRRVLLTSGDNQHHCYLFSLLDPTLSK